MSLPSAAKDEADRRLERYEIKRRLTRKVSMPPAARPAAVVGRKPLLPSANPSSPPGLAVPEAHGG